MVRWSGAAMDFPATLVEQRAGGAIFVVYADGTSEERAHSHLGAPLAIDAPIVIRRVDAPADRGVVRRIEGYALEIDVGGQTELTSTSRVGAG
jgi:hypothetical protein